MEDFFTLHTDGGARGNPGPAGIGGIIKASNGAVVSEFGEYIGEATNNVAEYKGLIKGLSVAIENGVVNLKCYLDSELIVKQLRGEYRVKDANLKLLYDDVQRLIAQFNSISFEHVPRKENKRADELVNEALDAAKLNG